ncbi:PEP-CTERM sorting domain-containing protein [Janthinobacterium sp. RB2R34]
MNNLMILRSAAFVAWFGAGAAQAQQPVITFNALERSGFGTTVFDSYSEAGYKFDNNFFYALNSPGQDTIAYAGSAGLTAAALSTTTMTRADGAAFSLDKISLANYVSLLPGAYDVTFVGTKAGGGTVSQTFTVDSSNNFNNSFSNYTFTGFSKLVSASWQEGLLHTYQVDNIRASVSAVPEPGTYAMLLAGLGLLGFMCRRKMPSGHGKL